MAMSMGGFGMSSSSSSSLSPSTTSATVAVDKATSDLLMGPDWTMNMNICDSVNSNLWQGKDVVKALKKRLQHKNPQVQLLALTLLETLVKNCGDYIHFQIAEKNILGEMVKIVKKKTDVHVRDKILVLVDSWQEAFGGPGGKYPQYYWAYEDLRRSGVQFPRRSPDTAPIFTPPVSHPASRHPQAGYGMPSNSTRTLDETMAADMEGLSASSLDSMRDIMELLNDMLQAVNPGDREAVKDEVIVDLVSQCRSNQKKLMQMLTTTGDEELLGKGLELNDSLQLVLAKHDALVSGLPMPRQAASSSSKASEGSSSNANPTEAKDLSPRPSYSPSAPTTDVTRSPVDDDEEEDEFAQLARRHTKSPSSTSSQGTYGPSGALVPVDNANTAASPTSSTTIPTNALALPDPPTPVRTTKEQDMIDLLSLTLSTVSTSPHPHAPQTPPASTQNIPQIPSSSGFPNVPQTYPGSQGQASYNNYVVPWAQPQPQQQLQSPSQPPLHAQYQQQYQAQAPQQFQPEQAQPPQQFYPQSRPQQPQSQAPQNFQHQQPTEQQFQPQPQQLQHPQQFYPQSRPQQLQSQASQNFQHQQPTEQPQPQQKFYAQSRPQQPQSQSPNQFQHHRPQQPQPQPPPHQQLYASSGTQQHPTHQPQPQLQFQSESIQQFDPRSQSQQQPQYQSQGQRQYPQHSTAYPPPPWAATPGFANGSVTNNMFSSPQASVTSSFTPNQAVRPLHHHSSFPSRGSNGIGSNSPVNLAVGSGTRNPSAPGGQKPFIPSYRLFEDLNVLGSGDGKYKTTSNASPSMAGTTVSQSIVGGKK